MDQSTELSRLLDERDIANVLTTYARAIDRCDMELLKTCFHADAMVHNAVGHASAHEYAESIIPTLLRLFSGTMHHVTHSNIKVVGDRAASEAYFVSYHGVLPDPAVVEDMFGKPYLDAMAAAGKLEAGHEYIGCGRYVDRHARRNGTWRIAERTVIMDWNYFRPAARAAEGSLYAKMPSWGRRDRKDPVYAVFQLD